MENKALALFINTLILLSADSLLLVYYRVMELMMYIPFTIELVILILIIRGLKHYLIAFFINEASLLAPLSILKLTPQLDLLYSFIILTSIMAFLVLGGFIKLGVFILALIPTALTIVFTLSIYKLFYGYLIHYMQPLNLNISYFTIFLLVSIMFLILFLLDKAVSLAIRG